MEAATDVPTVDELIDLIVYSPTQPKTASESNAEKNLRAYYDPEYYKAIRDVALRIQGDPWHSARNRFALSISYEERANVFLLRAHEKWHLSHLTDTGVFLYFASKLTVADYAVRNSDGTIEGIETLVDASVNSVFTNPKMLAVSDYVEMVYKHLDNLHALMRYRESLGLDHTSGVFVPLDEEHFAGYVKHGALGEGWL